MRSMIGEQIVDSNKKILGRITGQHQEDDQWLATIDDLYEVRIDGCTHHLDIFGYERTANPKLEASFVKLSILG